MLRVAETVVTTLTESMFSCRIGTLYYSARFHLALTFDLIAIAKSY